MRVLHLVTWLNRGGIEKWLLQLLHTIPRSECQIDVCCKGSRLGDLAPDARRAGAEVYSIPLGPNPLRYVSRVERLLRQGSYDLVHNHLQAHAGWGAHAARRAHVPMITSFHNTRFPAQRWRLPPPLTLLREFYVRRSIRYALRHSQWVAGCSASVLDQVRQEYGPVCPQRAVLYYGVECADRCSLEARAQFLRECQLPGDARLVVHVGRMVPQKNHQGLLKIFAEVLADVPEARLILIGDGPLRPLIDRQIQETRLAPYVRSLGTRDDVPRVLSCCDLFAFPSLFEGFGLAALEAQASGLPVVGSRLPALGEAVQDGRTAYLFPPHELSSMAQALIHLLRRDAEREAMALQARRHAQESFSLQATATRLLETYREILEETRGSTASGVTHQTSPGLG